MGAFSDNKENCPVCEHVNERPLTESELHAAALQENQALQATFKSTYCFRADQGDGPLFLDEEHGLLRIGEDGWVLEGKALRSFRISEDGAPLFENGIGILKCTVGDVPDRVNVMAAEIARFHLERQRFERWEAMDGLHRAGTESSEERRERERTNDLRRPRFDVPAPVREFRVELTLDHPYRTAFDARIAAPAFDRNYPRTEDYLKSYRGQTEELHLLAAKLMHMIAPGAGETQSGLAGCVPCRWCSAGCRGRERFSSEAGAQPPWRRMLIEQNEYSWSYKNPGRCACTAPGFASLAKGGGVK